MNDVCSDEIKSMIPPKVQFVRNARFLNAHHPFSVQLDSSRTNAFTNAFNPMTSREWNSLPASIFPSTYNFQSFKTSIHKYLQLHLNSWNVFLFFSRCRQGWPWEVAHPLGETPFQINIIQKKYLIRAFNLLQDKNFRMILMLSTSHRVWKYVFYQKMALLF